MINSKVSCGQDEKSPDGEMSQVHKTDRYPGCVGKKVMLVNVLCTLVPAWYM